MVLVRLNAIQKYVEDMFAEEIIKAELQEGDNIEVVLIKKHMC